MAIYLDIYNLIIRKSTIAEKYAGGITQFRVDYNLPASEINQEDDELFSLGQLNADAFNIDRLLQKGLSFDEEQQYSKDFTVVSRYGDLLWATEWIQHNGVFAWDIDTSKEVRARAQVVSEMFVNEIETQMEQGNNPLSTIRLEQL